MIYFSGEKDKKKTDDDEDITLDLDSLDLTLDEVEELKEGEAMETDDERISLSDAGLTTDELIEEDLMPVNEIEDEDIRLNIEEVAPEVSLEGESVPLSKEFKDRGADIESTDVISGTLFKGNDKFLNRLFAQIFKDRSLLELSAFSRSIFNPAFYCAFYIFDIILHTFIF